MHWNSFFVGGGGVFFFSPGAFQTFSTFFKLCKTHYKFWCRKESVGVFLWKHITFHRSSHRQTTLVISDFCLIRFSFSSQRFSSTAMLRLQHHSSPQDSGPYSVAAVIRSMAFKNFLIHQAHHNYFNTRQSVALGYSLLCLLNFYSVITGVHCGPHVLFHLFNCMKVSSLT